MSDLLTCSKCKEHVGHLYTCVTCKARLCANCSCRSRAGRVCIGAGICHQDALGIRRKREGEP